DRIQPDVEAEEERNAGGNPAQNEERFRSSAQRAEQQREDEDLPKLALVVDGGDRAEEHDHGGERHGVEDGHADVPERRHRERAEDHRAGQGDVYVAAEELKEPGVEL